MDETENKYAKNKATLADVEKCSEELNKFEVMREFRLIADDVTPEKIIEIMEGQGGTITISSAEGGIFDIMAGRYSKMPNLDIFLKAHACEPITIDRIGRRCNSIERPCLTMILTIQPIVMQGIMNPTFIGRGLCARFLYAVCDSKIGYRDADPDSISAEVSSEYNEFVERILSGTDKGIIKLNEEARTRYLEYAAAFETRLREDLSHIPEWGGKLVGAMLRIAALLHAAENSDNPCETPVSASVIERAILIADYLSIHAQAAHQTMGADETMANAKYLWKRIETIDAPQISKRDLHHYCKGKFKKAEEMTPALDILADMHYVYEEEIPTGGRPSVIIYFNPNIKGAKGTKV